MSFDDYADYDATGLADLVCRGEASPRELVDAAIARIESQNPALNAVVTEMFEQALATADASPPDGPFRGVPFLLKDLSAPFAAVRMSQGARWLADLAPDFDSVLVARYKRAGLNVLGKTNTPEFGLLPTTEPDLFGPSRNPWNPSRTPGGSSGGAAAAVASGMVPMAHGSDGGGSIRIPASCCGLFGLKPTRGRITFAPEIGDVMSGIVNHHAISRSVRDSAILLDASAGPAPGDPYMAPPPVRPFAKEVGAKPGRLRIGFSALSTEGEPVHPDCVAAVEDAARLCAELGHQVEDSEPPLNRPDMAKAFLQIWKAGLAWTVKSVAKRTGTPASPDRLEPTTWAFYEHGRGVTGADYLTAVQALQAHARDLAKHMEERPIWLTPSLAAPPPKLGHFVPSPDNPLQAIDRARDFLPFTPIANGFGLPAMSVPLFWNAQGLPIGVHFMARQGDEATLFRLAAQLEAARPWAGRRPALG